MSVDTPASLGLSLAEAKNQRTTKRPRMPTVKVTNCLKAIKKIREHELLSLEATTGRSFRWRLQVTTLLFERLGWK